MKNKIINYILLLFALLLGSLLVVKQWSNISIYPDSAHYFETANNLIVCGKPFYCLVTAVAKYLFDDIDFVMRIFSFICYIISIVLVYIVFGRIKQNLGLIASFLFAVSFTITSWVGFALPDSFAILLLLGGLWAGERWGLAVFLFFLAGLIRPEYLVLLPLSFFLYPKHKKAFGLSLFLFLSGAIYYIITYNLPYNVLFLKSSWYHLVLDLLKHDPLIVSSAVTGIFIIWKKKNPYKLFFLLQLVIFIIIYSWNNPINWRYGMHLILPLIYFSSCFISQTIQSAMKGVRAYDYILAIIGVLIIWQAYIYYS